MKSYWCDKHKGYVDGEPFATIKGTNEISYRNIYGTTWTIPRPIDLCEGCWREVNAFVEFNLKPKDWMKF